MKIISEWFIDAPWGKLALISCGTLDGPPVLMVHGRQDSAVTFTPLLRMLPETYYYVCVDLPGHGRSEPFPTGVVLSRMHFVGAVEEALKHLKWKEFIYVGHSLGSETGLFYNAVYPNRITKLVLLDPGPALSRLQVHDPEEYYKTFYDTYYSNYSKFGERKLYSKRQIMEAVRKARGFTEEQAELVLSRNLTRVGDDLYDKRQIMEAVRKARGFTEEQAELVLSRNLTRVGDDLYELSWDRRLKCLAPPNFPTDYYRQLWSKNCPPTLLVAAEHSRGGYEKGRPATLKLIADMEKNVKNFFVVSVGGGHDVHFTNPERFVKELCSFLDRHFECKSKL